MFTAWRNVARQEGGEGLAEVAVALFVAVLEQRRVGLAQTLRGRILQQRARQQRLARMPGAKVDHIRGGVRLGRLEVCTHGVIVPPVWHHGS
jgi:hypothetical protein